MGNINFSAILNGSHAVLDHAVIHPEYLHGSAPSKKSSTVVVSEEGAMEDVSVQGLLFQSFSFMTFRFECVRIVLNAP